MSKPVVEVQVRALAAASGGCTVFLGNKDKVFVMFVDESVGRATQQRAPIYVSLDVWDEVQDMTEVLQKMQEEARRRKRATRKRILSANCLDVRCTSIVMLVYFTACFRSYSRDAIWELLAANNIIR